MIRNHAYLHRYLGFKSLSLRQKEPKLNSFRFRFFFIQTARFGISSRPCGADIIKGNALAYHTAEPWIKHSLRFDDIQHFVLMIYKLTLDDIHAFA